MSTKSIDESVVEELVYIGAPASKSLKQFVSDRIDDIERYRHTGRYIGLTDGERLAIDGSVGLEVSWATTENDSARLVRNALLQAYVDTHDCKPGYVSRTAGKWVPGNMAIEKRAASAANLDWSSWQPANASTEAYLPQQEEPGVLRIRIAPPQ